MLEQGCVDEFIAARQSLWLAVEQRQGSSNTLWCARGVGGVGGGPPRPLTTTAAFMLYDATCLPASALQVCSRCSFFFRFLLAEGSLASSTAFPCFSRLAFSAWKPGVRQTKNHCNNSVTTALVELNAITATGMRLILCSRTPCHTPRRCSKQ